jgi:hypothetical protein
VGEVTPRRRLRHLTPANVASTIALVAVLGVGTALAGGNAGQVGGWSTKSFSFRAAPDTDTRPILNAGGLKLVAKCNGSGELGTWVARTKKNNASYYSYGYSDDDYVPDFDKSTGQDLSNGGERDAVYTRANGGIVVLQYFAYDAASSGSKCRIDGIAFVHN